MKRAFVPVASSDGSRVKSPRNESNNVVIDLMYDSDSDDSNNGVADEVLKKKAPVEGSAEAPVEMLDDSSDDEEEKTGTSFFERNEQRQLSGLAIGYHNAVQRRARGPSSSSSSVKEERQQYGSIKQDPEDKVAEVISLLLSDDDESEEDVHLAAPRQFNLASPQRRQGLSVDSDDDSDDSSAGPLYARRRRRRLIIYSESECNSSDDDTLLGGVAARRLAVAEDDSKPAAKSNVSNETTGIGAAENTRRPSRQHDSLGTSSSSDDEHGNSTKVARRPTLPMKTTAFKRSPNGQLSPKKPVRQPSATKTKSYSSLGSPLLYRSNSSKLKMTHANSYESGGAVPLGNSKKQRKISSSLRARVSSHGMLKGAGLPSKNLQEVLKSALTEEPTMKVLPPDATTRNGGHDQELRSPYAMKTLDTSDGAESPKVDEENVESETSASDESSDKKESSFEISDIEQASSSPSALTAQENENENKKPNARSAKGELGYLLEAAEGLGTEKPTRTRKRTEMYSDASTILPTKSPLSFASPRSPLKEDRHKADRHQEVMALCAMEIVNDMTKSGTNANGPYVEFAVLNHQNDTLFEFRLEVDRSGIPGSGKGVFLVFTGAKKPKSEIFQTREERLAERYEVSKSRDRGTMRTLTAQGKDGFDIVVSLEGERLHCDEDPIDSAEPKIGIVQQYSLEDYEEAPGVTFSSLDLGNGLLEIGIDGGRYGPYLKEDRKKKNIADIKNFIFKSMPAEYSFDCPGRLFFKETVIDITDDATGELHEVARHRIPPFVNEAGYDKERVQNVWACHSHNEHCVQYFCFIDKNSRMSQSDRQELYVDYFSGYEENRIRRGYGRVSLVDEVKGDDHEPTRLVRNFEERQKIVEMIQYSQLGEIYEILDFTVDRTLGPVSKVIAPLMNRQALTPLGAQQLELPTTLQLVARRSMHWLAPHFSERLRVIRNDRLGLVGLKRGGFPVDRILSVCEEWTRKLMWDNFHEFMALRDSFQGLANLSHVHDAMDTELREETLYLLRDRLPSPLDERLYCSAARILTRDLCRAVHTARSDEARGVAFRYCMKIALTTLREAIETNSIQELQFDSLYQRRRVISGTCLQSLNGIESRDSPLWRCSTVPKPVIVAIKDMLRKRKAQVEFDEWEEFDIPKLVYVSADGATALEPGQLEGGKVVLDEKWYVMWQVVFIVRQFAKCFGAASCSLEELCRLASIQTDVSLENGLNGEFEVRTFVAGTSQKLLTQRKKKGKSKNTKRQSGTKGRISDIIWEGLVWKTLREELNWTLDVGTRPTDYYFLPPGVKRCRGFSNRRDYWDSRSLVYNALKTHEVWSVNPVCQALLQKKKDLEDVYANLKSAKKLPKGELKLAWLQDHLKEDNGGSG